MRWSPWNHSPFNLLMILEKLKTHLIYRKSKRQICFERLSKNKWKFWNMFVLTEPPVHLIHKFWIFFLTILDNIWWRYRQSLTGTQRDLKNGIRRNTCPFQRKVIQRIYKLSSLDESIGHREGHSCRLWSGRTRRLWHVI